MYFGHVLENIVLYCYVLESITLSNGGLMYFRTLICYRNLVTTLLELLQNPTR